MNKKTKTMLLILLYFVLMIGIYIIPQLLINSSFNSNPSDAINNLKTYAIGVIVISVLIPIIPLVISSRKSAKTSEFKKNIKNMPTTNEFEILCSKVYSQDLSELVRKRKTLKVIFILQAIAAVIFVAIYLWFFINSTGSNSKYNIKSDDLKSFGYALGLIYIVIMYFTTNKLSKYAKEFKNKLISRFIQTLNPNMNFSADVPNDVNMRKTYEDSTFDKDSYNRFNVDDYIIDDVNNLQICDIDTKKVTGSGKSKTTTTIFQGLFCFTDLTENNLNSNIKISKNELKILEDNGRVKLDSNEFEKYFDVYAEDRVLATRILTSDVMTKMIDFYNRFKLTFEVVIQDNKLYLRFFTGPMFEPKVFGEIIEKNTLFVYYNVILFMIELSNTIKNELNNIDI